MKKKEQLDPYLLLALLNCPIVKRQMRAKQFTRDVIDTLGKRIFEVILPVAKDKQISLAVEGITEPAEEDTETLETI